MARKKKEDVQVQDNPGDSDGQTGAAHILNELARQIDIPDDKPSGISLRDQAVLHLLAGADLHRVGDDVIEHRIKRCINIANTVVKLLGEDNAEV